LGSSVPAKNNKMLYTGLVTPYAGGKFREPSADGVAERQNIFLCSKRTEPAEKEDHKKGKKERKKRKWEVSRDGVRRAW